MNKAHERSMGCNGLTRVSSRVSPDIWTPPAWLVRSEPPTEPDPAPDTVPMAVDEEPMPAETFAAKMGFYPIDPSARDRLHTVERSGIPESMPGD